jgi:hypothetical protein
VTKHIFNTPRSRHRAGENVEDGPKILEDNSREPFGEDVGVLESGGHVKNTSLAERHPISNKM